MVFYGLQWSSTRSTELLHFLLSQLVDHICIQESNFNSSSSFRIPGFSVCEVIKPTPSLACSLLMPCTLAAALSLLSGKAYPSLNFLCPLFSLLDSYSDYVGVKISLNNSSLLPFLNVYAPHICFFPTDNRADSFSPSILHSSRNLSILGNFNCHHPLWDSKGTFNPC